MKIAIISKADKSGGGASRVAQELCWLLQQQGHIAHHYLAFYESQPHQYAVPLYGKYLFVKLFARLNLYSKKLGFPEIVPWEYVFLHHKLKGYNLAHFHDISSAISPLTVRHTARNIPTVWTFHDCSPFTGGCLHPLDCKNYYQRCGNCPQLGQWPLDTTIDFTGFLQDIKRQTAQEERFVPVVPSTWLAQTALYSGMFKTSPKVIPHGLDTTRFRPHDRLTIRRKLNLPPDRQIILLVAAYLHDTRKGVNFALEALVRIKSDINPYLLLIGRITPETEALFDQFDYHFTGYITDEQLKSEYFAAADVFLSTSLAESFSLVTLETMATATPAVSFASGGITDLIEHNHTGYLVPTGDVAGLVAGLRLALEKGCAQKWGENARRRVEEKFTQELFLQNHLQLYQTVIQNFKP